jgi:hypothetical protein
VKQASSGDQYYHHRFRRWIKSRFFTGESHTLNTNQMIMPTSLLRSHPGP